MNVVVVDTKFTYLVCDAVHGLRRTRWGSGLTLGLRGRLLLGPERREVYLLEVCPEEECLPTKSMLTRSVDMTEDPTNSRRVSDIIEENNATGFSNDGLFLLGCAFTIRVGPLYFFPAILNTYSV